MAENQSTHKTMMILEALFQDDFNGKTLEDVIATTSITATTAWRILKTLKDDGWVMETSTPGEKKTTWKISDKLTEIAFQFKRHMLSNLQSLEKRYLEVSGEELRND